MRPILLELSDYVETGTVGRKLAPLVDEVGPVGVRIVGIKILGWLKAMFRTGKRRPLTFNESHSWCQNFRVLMSELPELRDLFEVKQGHIDFQSSVSEAEQLDIRKFVDAHYNPKLIA